jgi:hypothetical protein
MPDFINLPLGSIVGLLALLGAIDTGGSILVALAAKTFSAEYVTAFLASHVSKVWFPIFGLGLLGHGVEALTIPALPPFGFAASVALVAYAVATLGSLKGSIGDRSIVPGG